MTPEVYVDKEIMQLLLKAKCQLRRVIKQDFRPVYYTKDFNDEGCQDCDAYYIPTQAQVMKWLREVHEIYIEICTDIDYSFKHIIFRSTVCNKNLDILKEFDNCHTFEEACEAAIKYCLTNLI